MFEFNNFVTAGKFFLIIAGELIGIFVAVAFIIGLLLEYLPPARIKIFLTGRMTWVQYLLGAGLGAVTPFCSCSTVPIVSGLLKGGVPFGPVMAFLFSSPVLNPVIKGMGVGTVLALVIGGAGASIPEIIILGAIFKRRLIFAFCLTVFVVAVVAGYLVDVLVSVPGVVQAVGG